MPMKPPIHVDPAHAAAQREKQRRYDRQRGNSAKRGYGRRWINAAHAFLRHNPWCVDCRAHGRLERATCVDHVTPHKGDQRLFWDQSNWHGLCATHHSRKTALHDGGFGHAVRGPQGQADVNLGPSG